MKTSFKPITSIQRWRLAVITIGSALAVAFATGAFAADSAPTAAAAISPTAVWEGDTLTLDASGSHTNPLGGTLTYQWQQQAPALPVIALSPGITAVTATFTAPAVPLLSLNQAVQFRVKVNDSNTLPPGDRNQFSTPVITTVYASPGADAEPKGAHVNEGTFVQLMGSPTRTQPGATFTYTWTALGGSTFPTRVRQRLICRIPRSPRHL